MVFNGLVESGVDVLFAFLKNNILRVQFVSRFLQWSLGFPRTAGLFFCLSNCHSIIPGFCILFSVIVIAIPRLSPSVLFQDEPDRRQTRATVETPVRSRSRLWLLVSRLVSDSVFRLLGV